MAAGIKSHLAASNEVRTGDVRVRGTSDVLTPLPRL